MKLFSICTDLQWGTKCEGKTQALLYVQNKNSFTLYSKKRYLRLKKRMELAAKRGVALISVLKQLKDIWRVVTNFNPEGGP